jgi:hypothetical protein
MDFGEYEHSFGGGAVTLLYENKEIKDSLYITEVASGYVCKRQLKNISDRVLKLRELGVRIKGISFGKDPSEDYYYHVENPRVFQKMTLRVDYNRTGTASPESEFDEIAGNKWADPGVIVDRIGACPYQPFPAILISNYKTNRGVVHGTLSQKIFYHCYLLCHEDENITLDILSSFKDIEYRELLPGKLLLTSGTLAKPRERIMWRWFLRSTRTS